MVPSVHQSHEPNGTSISSAVFVRIPNAMLKSVLSMGKTPEIAPSLGIL